MSFKYVLNYCAYHFLFLECIRMSFLASTAFRLTMMVPMMIWGYASRSNAYSTTGNSDITSEWSSNAIWLEFFTITIKFCLTICYHNEIQTSLYSPINSPSLIKWLWLGNIFIDLPKLINPRLHIWFLAFAKAFVLQCAVK